jgi:hypothetical protein
MQKFSTHLNMHIPDSLFQDDKLFKALEECHSYLSDKSLSKRKPENWENQDSNYSQIRNMVQDLIIEFQEDQDFFFTQTNKRIASFFFLDFITSNYDLEILELEQGDKFEEKMRLTSSSFALLDDMGKIERYINKIKGIGADYQGTKINELGEEIMLVYSYLNLLLSKNQHLFNNSEMQAYCQTHMLNSMKENNEADVTQVINSHQYYFHKDPSIVNENTVASVNKTHKLSIDLHSVSYIYSYLLLHLFVISQLFLLTPRYHLNHF